MAHDYDPFATTSGLNDTIRGEITDAWFGTDNSYNNGETTVLKMTVQDPDLGEQELMFPCGSGWEAGNGGKTVTHTGGKKNFHRSSGVGLVITSAMDNGLGDMLRATGHTPLEADLWIGLNLVFERKEFEFRTKAGETHTYDRMLPVAVNEPAKGKKGGKKGGKKAAEVDEVDEADEADGFDIQTLDPKTRGKMKAIAAAAEDNEAFIEKLYTADMEIPDDIEAAVFSGELYQALKG